MSGRFHPRITFPLYMNSVKSGRFELEPFFSTRGYGIIVKVIFNRIGGTGKTRYEYERVVGQKVIIREMLVENVLWEMFADFIEGFYHNKVNQDVAVPISALLLKTYFSDMVQKYNLDLSEYITEIEFEKRKLGFDPHSGGNLDETDSKKHKGSGCKKDGNSGD